MAGPHSSGIIWEGEPLEDVLARMGIDEVRHMIASFVEFPVWYAARMDVDRALHLAIQRLSDLKSR